jgi:hypothetical protein
MEVRPGQRTATVAQAMAHNTKTIESDLDMFRKLLEARKDGAHVDMVNRAQKLLGEAYAIFLEQFGEFVAEEDNPDTHVHDHDHGHERTFVEQAHHDAGLARRFETR